MCTYGVQFVFLSRRNTIRYFLMNIYYKQYLTVILITESHLFWL